MDVSGASTSNNSTSISLQEIVDGEYLSTVNLQFHEETTDCSNNIEAPSCSSDDESSNEQKSKLHLLNATKVALLLSKAFANLECSSVVGEEGGNNYFHLEFLQLGDFILNIKPEKVAHSNNNFTAGLESGQYGFQEGAFDDDDDDDGIIDYDLLMSLALDLPSIDLNGDDTLENQVPNIGGEGISDTHKNSTSHSNTKTWTLLGIDIIPSLKSDPNQVPCRGKKTPMQMLGSHILAIYSRSNQQLSHLLGHAAIQPEKEDSSSEQRSSKQRVTEATSLFSILVETEQYPVSVCRLISDMIDSGDDGTANNPFTSFNDVIQDLEQMANLPEIFLYDQCNDFYSTNLLFGERCYGRVDELTNLLGISTRIERSENSSSPLHGSEAVFVSGAAGSGKSHLVQNVGSFLENLGWMVLKVKFKRDMKHGSREIVSSLFEKLVSNLVTMKSSDNEEDAEYSRRVATAISHAMDKASMSSLVEFIPSIEQLVPEIDRNSLLLTEADMSHWQLVFLLTKLFGAILSLDRRIMICLDDLQWCDSTMLTVIWEIIISVGQNDQGRKHFLFVGMYREEEITESHPFANQLASLRRNNNVTATEIKLTSLSIDNIAEMIMSETRLPRRLVRGLAGVVHKKTSGHALFVVQLLNLLVRDSTIAYSPRKHRFDWNESKIAALGTLDSVASLIVSNLSLLQTEALQSLRTLSCFGVQIPLSLVKLLDDSSCAPKQGIEYFLPGLSERGVVEVTGPSVFFSHDLVQQHVYDNIPTDDRLQLHLDIGTYIASKIGLDSSLPAKSVEDSVEELNLGNPDAEQESPTPSYALVAIATNQINFAGPKAVSDHLECVRFARWNLSAGKGASQRSNFQAALYYYKSGIAFMGDELWLDNTLQLCHDLHEGAAFALFGTGEYSLAAQKAKAVIDHIPFEESLVAQYILFRCLDNLGRYEDGVAMGLELLRKLKFDIPSDPSLSSVVLAMAETEKAASVYSFPQITNTHQIVDLKKRNVFKILEAMIVSFFRSASPYLPIVACAAVNYSLHNGICEESAIAFMLFGYFQVALGEKYDEGRYWGSVCLKLLEGASAQLGSIRTDAMTRSFLLYFYTPFKNIAVCNFTLYQKSMALGANETGEKLTLVLNSYDELIKSMMKHSKEGAKLALLDKLIVSELVGRPLPTFPDFGGVIFDERFLLADALSNGNLVLIEAIHTRRFISAFWRGDYDDARKCSQLILALPSSKMIKIQLVFHTYFRGLIAFQVYRDGQGEEWFDEGKKVLDKMEVWAKHSAANFENKLRLLEAEYHASMCNITAAKAAYEASARLSREHGLIHEQGLACELYAKFLTSIIETDGAMHSFKCAHACYVQWGAAAKAEQVWQDNNLGSMSDGSVNLLFSIKQARERAW